MATLGNELPAKTISKLPVKQAMEATRGNVARHREPSPNEVFWSSFNATKETLSQALEKRDRSIEQLQELIESLQNLLNPAAQFLPPYDVRQAQQVISNKFSEWARLYSLI